MTREEAKEVLDDMKVKIDIPKSAVIQHKRNEAIDMAIKALEHPERNVVAIVPCGDTISRQAVNTLVDELARAISDERCCMPRGRSTATIMQDILDLPSVNPQKQRTGHWIKTPLGFKCSRCLIVDSHTSIFCPSCGAKMIEEPESEGKEMTEHEADVIGGLNMTDQISNEAYKQIMIAARDEGEVGYILDMIRAEIKEHADRLKDSLYGDGMRHCIDIIDKYRAESENEECI